MTPDMEKRLNKSIEEFGNRRLQLKQRSFSMSLSALGQVAWEYMQFLYGEDKIIRIVQPDGTDKLVELNLVDRVDPNTIRRIMDVSTGSYDVKAIAASTLASNRWAEMQEYKNLLEIGAIDLEEFWKKTNIFDKEGLLKRKGEVQKLSAQLEQVAGQLEQTGQALQKSHSENQQLMKRLTMLEYELQTVKKAGKE